jgi:hypothetical protein
VKEFTVKYRKESELYHIYCNGELFSGLIWGFETKKEAKGMIKVIKKLSNVGNHKLVNGGI